MAMAAELSRPATQAPLRTRLQSIDLLRGVVMVIMAIDHARDLFHADSQRFSPEDLTQTTAAIFFTRWITHFCAPTFVFLAGTSAYLLLTRGRRKAELSRFLWTRGLWLLVVEMTLFLFAATFNLTYEFVIWQVLWALGWSMIALSVLIHLRWTLLLAVALAMIGLHNLLDGIAPAQFGSFDWLWTILHVGMTPLVVSEGHTILVVYPLIPWIGVMAAGYCFGRVWDLTPDARRQLLWRLGGTATMAFLVLRAANAYGDPAPWSTQSTPVLSLLSFLNVTKYPPSLMFLLMTLGPALIVLALLDRVAVSDRHPLLVFGRVPFFFYLAHWYSLHLLALPLAWLRYGHVEFIFGLPPTVGPFSRGYPADYGYSLLTLYAIWFAVIVGLYPVCLWFSRVKARSRATWLSYL
jgi:uncharacterized membrane protein